MQNASRTLQSVLKERTSLKAVPKVTFEWNQNRYAGISKIDNVPSDELTNPEIDTFPIETIALPQRPKRGIIKARTSPPVYQETPGPWRRRQAPSGDEGFTSGEYTDVPNATRYYTAGPESAYKYWSSPKPSGTATGTNGFPFPAGFEVSPYILYKNTAHVNKIVVGLENSWARPVNYDIQVTQNSGSTWSTVASNLLPNSDGQVIIYRQNGGSWSQTKNLSSVTTLNGIRLVVKEMSNADAYFNLIELSPRLELDMSPYVITYETNMEMSSTTFLTPIGQASSNTGSVTLSNVDQLFNNENEDSLFYKLIDKNILVSIDLEYDLNEYGGGLESVREATMYVDQWSTSSDLEMTAELKDSSKFLQEEKVPQTLLQNITVGEAIWRICDSIGFNNYVYDTKETESVSHIEYFWTEEEDTVWDTFQSLAQATQTAVYFDEFDILRIKSRESALDLEAEPVWELEATNNRGRLADIVEANISADYESNIVNVKYQTTKVSDDNKGFPEMQVLWTPEDSFVLRSSRLVQRLTATADVMRITTSDVKFWPYEGLVNIEGELIKYNGKEYSYYSKAGPITTVWVYSDEEKTNIDRSLSNIDNAFKNTWTGRIKIKERGVYWTSPRDHLVDISGWSGRMLSKNVSVTNPWQGGISHIAHASLMRVTSPATASVDASYVAVRGRFEDQPYRRYGTRMRISPASHTGSAGIGIMIGPSESGYYVELTPTNILDANAGALRKTLNEVSFYSRHVNGNQLRLGGPGARAQIIRDAWYDLDVDLFMEPNNGPHNITIYLNGIVMMRIRLSSGRVAQSGRVGTFVRGRAIADYEYFFAHAGGEEYRTDEVSQFDKVRGGFVSGQWDREYVYSSRNATRKIGKNTLTYKQNYNQYLFDEFGPIVHEIRELDVPFEKFPVLHSRLYVSNSSEILCPEYVPTPFGAKFMLANTSRNNSVAHGEDTLKYGPDNPINQVMMIYGRLIFQEEAQTYTVKNKKGLEENPIKDEDSIRRRGKVEVDIDSRWIQSKSAAEALGNWILKHWAGGSEELEVEVFGNPLFQIGDLVTVDYPDKDLYRTTHKYFVVRINNSFNNGLQTTLTLRRAKI